jgi:hypothetical protein
LCGALLRLKSSRIAYLVSFIVRHAILHYLSTRLCRAKLGERRAKIIHPHGFTVRYRACSLLSAILPLALCSLLIVNCKSTPEVTESSLRDNSFAPLDTGALAYVFVNVKQARSVLNILPVELLKDKQTRNMIDKTSFCVAAIFPKENTRLFQAVSWGNYPSFRAGLGFTFSRKWKKVKSAGETYWHSSANNLSLVLNSEQAFVASSPSYPVASAPGVKTPESFSEFSRQSPVSCWVEDSAPLLSGILREAGLPLQVPVRQLFVNLYPAQGDQCEALIRMQFENATFARGMAALLNLAGNFSSDSVLAKLLFSNTPVQNGNSIDIKTAVMNERDLSLLFNMFFIYLN